MHKDVIATVEVFSGLSLLKPEKLEWEQRTSERSPSRSFRTIHCIEALPSTDYGRWRVGRGAVPSPGIRGRGVISFPPLSWMIHVLHHRHTLRDRGIGLGQQRTKGHGAYTRRTNSLGMTVAAIPSQMFVTANMVRDLPTRGSLPPLLNCCRNAKSILLPVLLVLR